MAVAFCFALMLFGFVIGDILKDLGTKQYKFHLNRIGNIIMITGPIILGIVFIISTIVTINTNEYQYILKDETKLEMFKDNFFVIGNRLTGISTELNITYMIKENGTIQIKSKEVDNSTEIIEIDSDIATLKKYRKTVNTDNVFHKWFFIGDSIITVFEIPKDSIKYEYAIDLE